MKIIFNFLIFPGFLFTATLGLLVSWVDRKLTARIQWRKGPPWYQNFLDFIKLLGKETITPSGAPKITFLISPLLALIFVTLISLLVGCVIINPQESFLGDLIVVLYLSIIPAIAVIVGGSASGNPLASVGASREIKLVLSYELPFILCCLIPVIKSSGTVRIGEILNYQIIHTSIINSLSGIIAFILAIICLQAKLGLIPFDIAEAEQEIMAGPYIEYSGLPLAIFKLIRSMLLFILPIFLIIIFWMSNLNILTLALKYILILVIIILLKNTNPRIRIDQAIKFFWGPITIIAFLAIILSLMGY